MHYEALTKEGQRIFKFLDKFDGFVLAGGTALALHIGHRVSVDFDFFTEDDIDTNLLPKVKRVFSEYSVAVLIDNKEELTFLVNKIKVTFLKYPFKQIYKNDKFEELELFSIKEIALMKAYSVGRRGAYKDYLDLFYILKGKHILLDEIIEKCSEKYGDAFNSRLFLEQLIYLDDVEEVSIQFLNTNVSKNDVKNFLENEVANFSNQLKANQ
jgi:predicted nucleotidyltransferase component of viral defense system